MARGRLVEAGCSKWSAGPTHYCVAHGGGHRCYQDGCDNAAAGGPGYCKVHGGRKRRTEPGCTSAARSGGRCTKHGGGARCQELGCGKGARGNTGYCHRHWHRTSTPSRAAPCSAIGAAQFAATTSTPPSASGLKQRNITIQAAGSTSGSSANVETSIKPLSAKSLPRSPARSGTASPPVKSRTTTGSGSQDALTSTTGSPQLKRGSSSAPSRP
jgi:hypothetical protein